MRNGRPLQGLRQKTGEGVTHKILWVGACIQQKQPDAEIRIAAGVDIRRQLNPIANFLFYNADSVLCRSVNQLEGHDKRISEEFV